MTAHRPKPVTLTPEIVERFRDYHRRHLAWGIFHVSLDDGNYECGAARERDVNYTDEERELAALFNVMTPSQRRRLAWKADV